MRLHSSFILLAALLAAGCGSSGSSSGRSGSASTVAPSSSTTPGSTTNSTGTNASAGTAMSAGTIGSPGTAGIASTLVAPKVVPVILIHGHTGDPTNLVPLLNAYGRGRVTVAAMYAGEADALKPGDLPLACVVNAGYYRASASSPLYDPDANGRGQGSIGSCVPVRDDGNQGLYPISYAERISHVVDGVLRATGSDRVDLVCHSMGNLVGRAYTRWLSDNGNGTSKVRKLYCLAGPHRGINAVEATIDGLDNAPTSEFMIKGENMEMCSEYNGWAGASFTSHLNDGWDTFCASFDVHYGGITGTGPYGPQPQSGGATIFGINLASLGLGGSVSNIVTGLSNLNFTTLGDTLPLWLIAIPNITSEVSVAFGPSDGTVRLASSRMDQAPFGRTDFWAQFEGTHAGTTDVEQTVPNSTFASELAREYLAENNVATGGTVTSADLKLVDSSGHASWLALETNVTGAPLVSAQIIEETLDSSGNPVTATGYGCPVDVGAHAAMIPIPAGGGSRLYRIVLYGPSGSVFTQDKIPFTLTDGTLETPISTAVASATPSVGPLGTSVQLSVSSNAPAGDPTLQFSWKLDGGLWSAYTPTAAFDTPPLGPGEHRFEVRSRHAHNAAAVLVEDPLGAAVGLFVDTTGALTLRR